MLFPLALRKMVKGCWDTISVYSVPSQLIFSAACSLPRGCTWHGLRAGSFRHFHIGEQPDEPWEDTAKIKAPIPHCYLLSLANFVLCLPVIPHLCTLPPCSPSVKVCVKFLKCSTFLPVSGSLYVLFPQPQRLFFLPVHLSGLHLSVTCSGKPSLRIPPNSARQMLP